MSDLRYSTGRVNIPLAWVGMLLASALPAILWNQLPQSIAERRFLSLSPSVCLPVAGLVLLVAVALLRPAAREMRWPLVMLLAFLVGWRVTTPWVLSSATWIDWQARQSLGMSLAASRLQWAPPLLLMALVGWRAGFNRRQLFLAVGEWSAPVERDPLFPFKGWRWFPAMFVVFLLAGWASVAPTWGVVLNPDFDKTGRLVEHWPGILGGAALNAIAEEFVFRIFLLPFFIQSVGVRQAVALTGILFGLEHWETSGPWVLLACYGGWIFAKSMTETRGCSWALVQHILGDIPVYALVACARS